MFLEPAFYQSNHLSLANTPGLLGAGYFIPILGVPLLLVTHVLAFRLLMRKEVAAPRVLCAMRLRSADALP